MSNTSFRQVRFVLVLIVILSLARTQTVHAQQGTFIIKDRNSATQADVVADGGGSGINALAVTTGAAGLPISCATATNCKVAIFTSLGAEISAVTDPCDGSLKTKKAFTISSATTTVLVAASSSNKVYICSWTVLPISATGNLELVEDASGSCASPDAGLFGGTTDTTGANMVANQGFAVGNGGAMVEVTASTNVNVCAITSTTAKINGTLTYVLAP